MFSSDIYLFDWISKSHLFLFLFDNSGVAGVTFGIDDIYDAKAASSYATDRSHVQKNNYAQHNGSNKKSKNQQTSNQSEKGNSPAAKKVEKVEKAESPTKLLGGWEDQGALRIAWDDDF